MIVAMTPLEGCAGDPTDLATTIVALICCHNRKSKTLQALESLKTQDTRVPIKVSVVLFDDGSSDGTAAAVMDRYPAIAITYGTGNTFWSASMAAPQKKALDQARPDYILWLNDDVLLHPEAPQNLVSTARTEDNRVVVAGALTDAITGETTYAGYRRVGRRPLQLKQVTITGAPQQIATFNGNVVLVPRSVYQTVGAVDERLVHTLGDIDYGYRVGAHGFSSVQSSGEVGACSRNSLSGTWLDSSIPILRRCHLLFDTKGVPLGPYRHFMRRHGGRAWPFLYLATYVRAVAVIVGSSGQRWSHARCTTSG